MNRYEIKKGTARATVRAVDFPAAVQRAAEIGFKDPDVVRLLENEEEARAKAMRAYANISDRAEREAERRALGGEN